jgi:hypothetical protein
LYSFLKANKDSFKNNDEETNRLPDLVTKHNILIDMIIKQVDPNGLKVYGNIQFNIMLFTLKTSSSDVVELSKVNKLSIVNIDQCVNKLKDYYKINDMLVVKTEQKNEQKSGQDNNISINYFNILTRQPLDKAICQGLSLKIPVVLGSKDREDYLNFMNKGVDIYNSRHPAFRTRCYSFTDPNTDYDTTLDYRIKNYLRNRTECFQTGCSYSGMSLDGYVDCQCDNSFETTSQAEQHLFSCTAYVRVMLY